MLLNSTITASNNCKMSQTFTNENRDHKVSAQVVTRCLSFNKFELRLPKKQFFKHGVEHAIDPKIVSLLSILIDARPNLVTKEKLMDALWPDTEVTDWSLSRLISDARKVLEDDGKEQQIIRTIRGKGYAFVVDVDERNDTPVSYSNGDMANLPFANLDVASKHKISSPSNIVKISVLIGLLIFLSVIAWSISKSGLLDYSAENELASHNTLAHRYEIMLSLQKNLTLTKTVFIAQVRRRNELGKIMLPNRPDLKTLSWEQRFRVYYAELNDDEKFIFDQIRAMTAGPLYKGNKAILNILSEHPEMYQEIPLLVDLYSHLEIWVNKHTSVFQHREDMPLVYVGVEDGVPFPSEIDHLVSQWLSDHQQPLNSL